MISKKFTHFIPLVVLVLCVLGLSACASVSVSEGVSCKTAGPHTCTITVTATEKFDAISCEENKPCQRRGGVLENFLAVIGNWTERVLGIQEAYGSPPSFDASQVRIDLSTTQVAITNSTGNVVVSLYNGTTLVAQNTFAYYRSGNSLYATDPGTINAWISSVNSSYDSIQINNANDLAYTDTTTADVTALVNATTVYQGTTEASGSTSFEINAGCGKVGTGCKQK